MSGEEPTNTSVEEWKAQQVQVDGEEPTNTSVEETPEGEQAKPKEDAATEETLTMDEWKAQQNQKDAPKFNVKKDQQAKKDAPKLNMRKAGEGSDIDPKWKKAAIYKKDSKEPERGRRAMPCLSTLTPLFSYNNDSHNNTIITVGFSDWNIDCFR